MNDDKIEKIQQELKQLSLKQVELERNHQQRVKSHEEQKTLYQHLFGQPPLLPDPELQSVKDEIAHLKTREVEYLKILQAAASILPSVEEKDWRCPNFITLREKSKIIFPSQERCWRKEASRVEYMQRTMTRQILATDFRLTTVIQVPPQVGRPLPLQHGRQQLAPVGHGAGPKALQSYRVCCLQ